jgi:xylulokinase
MMDQYLLGIDVGTGSCKVIIIDVDGNVAGEASRPYGTSYPKPLWAEQSPEDWYEAFRGALSESARNAGISAGDIRGVGITGQMKGLTLLRRDGDAIRPTLLWNDRRCTPQLEWIGKKLGPQVYDETYNPVDTTSTIAKILWIMENEPETWKETYKIQFPKDYVRLRLTGTWFTDCSDASGTSLFNVGNLLWSQSILEKAGISADKLPDAVPSVETVGEITGQASGDTGLLEGTPVVAGGSDTTVESVACGLASSDQCKIRLGTAGSISVCLGKPVRDPKKRNYCYAHSIPGNWIVDTNIRSCGLAREWYKNTFCGEETTEAEKSHADVYSVIDRGAKSVPVGSDGLIFHPYLMGEDSPYYDPYLKGSFFGVTVRHRKEHFARAVLEGVAYALRDAIGALGNLRDNIHEYVLVGGGTKSPLWSQIICDALGINAMIPRNVDASFGAAMLAGIGNHVFSSPSEAVRRCVKVEKRICFDQSSHEKYSALFEVYMRLRADLSEDHYRLRRVLESSLAQA